MMDQQSIHPHSESLLHTKLEIPNLAHRIVRRERLLDLLYNAPEQNVTLITAPAGYGKTTLLCEWLSVSSSPDNRFAWVTLDMFDNAPFRFWAYVITALKKVIPKMEFDLDALIQHGYEPSALTRLIPLSNEIGLQPVSINLILDDFHVITNDDIHKGVTYLIEHQPRNLHLILASRTKPPLHTTRIRTLGRLKEINAENLAFSLDETHIYLSELARMKNAEHHLNDIYKLTQGWVAGLQLAVLSRANTLDLSKNVLSDLGSSHEFPEYFSEEVLSQQDQPTQEFIIKTSILNDFCADLCDFLLGIKNSQGMIDFLIDAHLFITPLDSQRCWYRWHPLFSSALKHQLEKKYPDEVQNLHGKAMDWFIQNGFPDKAVLHALMINQMKKAAEIIDKSAMQAIINFDLSRLIHWINAIPDALLLQKPVLGIYQATAFFLLGQYHLIETKLVTTENILKQLLQDQIKPEESDSYYWEINAIRASVESISGDAKKGIAFGQKLIEDHTKEGNYYYGMLVHALGMGYERLGKLESAVETFNTARIIGITNHFQYGCFHSSSALAFVRKNQGRLHDAAAEFEQALDTALEYNLENATVTLAQAGLLEISLEQNKQDTDELARSILSNFDKTVISDSAWINHITRCLVLVNYFISKNDLDSAWHYFDKAALTYRNHLKAGFPILAEMIDVRVRLLRAEARQKGTSQFFQGEDEFLQTATFSTIAGKLARARVYLSQKKNAEAVTLLNGLLSDLKKTEFYARDLEARVLLALALYNKHNEQPAFQVLFDVLSDGAKEGYIRVFTDEGKPMKTLLSRFRKALPTFNKETGDAGLKAYIDDLLDRMEKTDRHDFPVLAKSIPEVSSILPMQEPLSEREQEVFHLLLQRKTKDEIAGILTISPNTTKTHIRNIYRKFDVHSQKLLIQRAEELGLT